MTPEQLLNKLVSYKGPCFRICAYCPEDYDTKEVKECVEEMIRQQYVLKQCNDDLMKEIIQIRKAYKEATGREYPLERQGTELKTGEEYKIGDNENENI